MKRLYDKVGFGGIMAAVITVAVLIFLVFATNNAYMERVVPSSVDPCDPESARVVRDTKDSKWPIKRDPEERCKPKTDE